MERTVSARRAEAWAIDVRDLFARCVGRSDSARCILATVLLFLSFGLSAQAATSTWNGGGGNVNWSTAGNWTSGAPATGADVIFSGSTNVGTAGTPLNQNIGNPLNLNSLTFSAGGGAFFLGGNNLRFDSTLNTITQSSSSAVSIANGISAPSTNSTVTITLAGNGSGLVTMSGNILSGSGQRDIAIVKSGSSTFLLSGTNTYTGGTSINGGTIELGSSGALSTSGTISFGGGTLQYSASNTTDYSSRFSTAINQAYSIDTNGQNVTLATALTSVGGSMTKIGAGTLTLSGVNTYTGGTAINGGTLALGSASALGVSGTISFGGGALQYSAGNTTDYSSRFSTAASQAYNIDTNGQNVTYATALTSSSGTMTKAGTGTLTLTGTNTFSGATTINGGTLKAAGSSGAALGSTSSITVNSGGTLLLGASNQINDSATITMAGGTFSKGNFNEGTAGGAGMGALTLTANGSHIDFGTGTTGVLSFAGLNASTFTITIDNWTGTPNQVGSGGTDRLIFNSDQSGNLGAFVFTGYGAGAMEFALGGGFWEVTAVPEPSTWFVGFLAIGGLMFFRRHRRSIC